MGKFTYVCDQCGIKITTDGLLTLFNKVKAHKHKTYDPDMRPF